MSGVPNQLWKRLTSLLGDDGDGNTDMNSIVEQRIECETSSSLGTVHGNATPIGTDSFSDQNLSETGPNVTGDSGARDVVEVGGVEVEADVEEVDENDDSDVGSVVEIGIDECCMLKQCLTRKLYSLLSTNERYTLSILFNHPSIPLYTDLIQLELHHFSLL